MTKQSTGWADAAKDYAATSTTELERLRTELTAMQMALTTAKAELAEQTAKLAAQREVNVKLAEHLRDASECLGRAAERRDVPKLSFPEVEAFRKEWKPVTQACPAWDKAIRTLADEGADVFRYLGLDEQEGD